MKASLATIGLVFCCAQIGFAQTNALLCPFLERAVTATGAEYIVARKQLVSDGSNDVSALMAISTNSAERWQVRLVAGIAAERILKGAEIDALINREWQKEPSYNKEWNEFREGPVVGLKPLIIRRCKELGLWWHYMEVVWKETGEHSKKEGIGDVY